MFLNNIINNVKKRFITRKIGVPFSYEDVVYYTHLPKIPLSDYSYIDVKMSDIKKNEVYVIDTTLNLVNLYRLTNIDATEDNIIINIEFDEYLTMFYNFDTNKYVELSDIVIDELNNLFDKHKQINSTYDDIDISNYEMNVKLSFIDSNYIREKLKLIDVDELFCYLNINFKMIKEHINNNVICDIEFNDYILMDDDEIIAFTNFNLQNFKKIFAKQTKFNVR